ncbi:hypothetical protein ACFQH8_08840 [Halomicroarcula sp. GCM10025710]
MYGEVGRGPPQDGDSDTDDSEQSAAARESPPVLLETLAARVPEPVVVVDSDLHIAVANDRLADLVGLSSSVLVGEPVGWLFPGCHRRPSRSTVTLTPASTSSRAATGRAEAAGWSWPSTSSAGTTSCSTSASSTT